MKQRYRELIQDEPSRSETKIKNSSNKSKNNAVCHSSDSSQQRRHSSLVSSSNPDCSNWGSELPLIKDTDSTKNSGYVENRGSNVNNNNANKYGHPWASEDVSVRQKRRTKVRKRPPITGYKREVEQLKQKLVKTKKNICHDSWYSIYNLIYIYIVLLLIGIKTK